MRVGCTCADFLDIATHVHNLIIVIAIVAVMVVAVIIATAVALNAWIDVNGVEMTSPLLCVPHP